MLTTAIGTSTNTHGIAIAALSLSLASLQFTLYGISDEICPIFPVLSNSVHPSKGPLNEAGDHIL